MKTTTKQTWLNALPMGIGGYLALTLPAQHPGAQLSMAAALIGFGLWRELGGRSFSFAGLAFVVLAMVVSAMAWAATNQPHAIFYLVFMCAVAGMAQLGRKVRK